MLPAECLTETEFDTMVYSLLWKMAEMHGRCMAVNTVNVDSLKAAFRSIFILTMDQMIMYSIL